MTPVEHRALTGADSPTPPTLGVAQVFTRERTQFYPIPFGR